jgi:predicted neuraminidase
MSFPVLLDPRQLEVHASTLLLVGNKLLCAWFGGTKEGNPDTKIWLSTLDLAGSNANWTESRPVAIEDGIAHWNPVLLELPGSKILLFYKVGSPISSWYTKIIESEDGGITWSKPKELVPGDRGAYLLIPISLRHNALTSHQAAVGRSRINQ